MYSPDIHGMKQPKWIESIEAIDHWEPGFWVDRGWNKVAQMHATSVIDTVAIDMTIIGAEGASWCQLAALRMRGREEYRRSKCRWTAVGGSRRSYARRCRS
jgi:hypothetical protein